MVKLKVILIREEVGQYCKLMHSLYILSLILCDPQRKRNHAEYPQAKEGSQFYCPSWGFVQSVEKSFTA